MSLYDIADPRFAALVLPNARLEVLGEGFRWLEGPVWFPAQELLLFSDIPNNRVLRWCDDVVTIYQAPSDFANGHARDNAGRLLSCLHHGRAVTRREHDGSIQVLAARHEGKRLNSPNDIAVQWSSGDIWFTDPDYGINTDYEGGKQVSERPPGLFRLDARTGRLELAADDFAGPNGLAFAPDERRLYVTETGAQFDPQADKHIRVFDLDGARLTNGRVFARIEPGYADGLACDAAGNLWCSAGDGVHCLSPEGELLGRIDVGGTVSNLTFGGRNLSRLFLCAGTRLLALYTNARGQA